MLAAVPPQRTSGVRPLWLRVEWNMLELGELDAMIAQAAARGVRVHVPQVWGGRKEARFVAQGVMHRDSGMHVCRCSLRVWALGRLGLCELRVHEGVL